MPNVQIIVDGETVYNSGNDPSPLQITVDGNPINIPNMSNTSMGNTSMSNTSMGNTESNDVIFPESPIYAFNINEVVPTDKSKLRRGAYYYVKSNNGDAIGEYEGIGSYGIPIWNWNYPVIDHRNNIGPAINDQTQYYRYIKNLNGEHLYDAIRKSNMMNMRRGGRTRRIKSKMN